MSFLPLGSPRLLLPFCLLSLGVGAVRAQSAADFVSLPPCRLVDTRYAVAGISFGPPFLPGKTARDFPVPAGSCHVPATALSYSLNITLVPRGPVLYVTAWPTGQPQPNASTMNAPQGNIIANAALVPAGANGSISVYVDGDTDLIVDINGYFVPPSTAAADTLTQQVTQLGQQISQAAQQANLSGAVNAAANTIAVGNTGQPNDNGTIRIGTPGVQQKTYIAGISGAQVDIGEMVIVGQDGQLGTILSSARYKEDIQDIGAAGDALLRLRPVQFRYKQAAADGGKPLQFGLVAEEVAQVLPELAVRNRKGEIETVQYQQLPALLLHELQKQHRLLDQQQEQIQSQRDVMQKQQEAMQSLLTRLAALEAQTRAGRGSVPDVEHH